MIRAPLGPTKPDAGVIVARPAIQPVAVPTKVGLPCLTYSIIIQINAAVAAEICVTVIAIPALPSAASALPPLNPNQPIHSIDVPIIANGGL